LAYNDSFPLLTDSCQFYLKYIFTQLSDYYSDNNKIICSIYSDTILKSKFEETTYLHNRLIFFKDFLWWRTITPFLRYSLALLVQWQRTDARRVCSVLEFFFLESSSVQRKRKNLTD